MALLKTIYLQQEKYPAEMDRYAVFAGLQRGTFNGTDFQVTAQVPAAMAVNIGAGRILVPDRRTTAGAWLGKFLQVNDATLTRAIGANSSGVTRIDQAIVMVNDTNTPNVIIVPGTPTAGATVDNRNGAVSDATLTTTYGNWERLADIQVDNGATSIGAAKIRDRRARAQGAGYYAKIGSLASNITLISPTFVDVDPLFTKRFELTGVPVEIEFNASAGHNAAVGNQMLFQLADNGVAVPDSQRPFDVLVQNKTVPLPLSWDYTPSTPGSHVLSVQGRATAGTITIFVTGGANGASFSVEEKIRGSSSND